MYDRVAQNLTPDPLGRWRFAVDRGGTFTDVVGIDPTGHFHAHKLLSKSNQYKDAAIEGIRHFLRIPSDAPLPHDRVAWIRLGTTVATNALLERKGAAVGLLITQGFRDLLAIGDQRRPDLFALAIRRPEQLYQSVEEVDERMSAEGQPLRALSTEQTRQALSRLQASGVTSVAILFLHAWKNNTHEQQAATLAHSMGFDQISVSHQTLSMIHSVGRGQTTLLDAYLTPVLHHYVRQIQRWTGTIPLHFMGSMGRLLLPEGFTGKDAILSGPAGGVIGVATMADLSGDAEVIGFDMGGTSTDVCRYDGQLERIMEAETAGIRFHAPMLHVETVAAGGGSILHFDGQKLSVGPDSAGSDPGPACYGLGGPATLTDANLILGRIQPDFFPSLFGPCRNGPLSQQAARDRLTPLMNRVRKETGQHHTLQSLALGFVRIANETMGRPIKNLSVARGFDLRHHLLTCFGGAGGQHACGIAATLHIKKIRLHPLSGVQSAYGIAMARHGHTHAETRLAPLTPAVLAQLDQRIETLRRQLEKEIKKELGQNTTEPFETRITLDLRVPGTDTPLPIEYDPDIHRVESQFRQKHRQYYGFTPPSGPLELLHLQLEVVESSSSSSTPPVGEQTISSPAPSPPPPEKRVAVWFCSEKPTETPLYTRKNLRPGTHLTGPLLIVEPHATTVVEPGFDATVSHDGLLTLTQTQTCTEEVTTHRDPVLLELFNHRFSGIAARMGETLVRTAHSVNIKERLDFSCALFDRQGRLVANAPHVPVHLGAMGATVASLLATKGHTLQPGDVYLTNDPGQGGSHLPDLTVITPVFLHQALSFFVASRGHHADIGGTTPGSMPPFARSLQEEGVILTHQLMVRQDVFLQDEVIAALSRPPYPARNLPERLSDLRAMVAAGERGVQELTALCNLYGIAVITHYMDYVRQNAAHAMEQVLSRLLADKRSWSGRYEDSLDGGEKIAVHIHIHRTPQGTPRARIDFTGTSPPHDGNLNAPTAITRAAVLYVFRTLIQEDIPLNDGCLIPLTLHIPPDTLLHPPTDRAVAGGNVETSQRVVDVLYGALGVAAASQGTMNNFLFGNLDGSGHQYYETIAGGSGATRGHDGASGVQVHMTNTRITDPEVLEHRFPHVRLERFSLRTGSGGKGQWCGGEGVIRSFLFTTPLSITLLSQRRRNHPFGCYGGRPGAKGENRLWKKKSQNDRGNQWEEILLPGSFQGEVEPGDRLEIRTPGGGGFGNPEEREKK